ncbi:hypothetical protein MRX96_015927 [Rhipicephalus microplus]
MPGGGLNPRNSSFMAAFSPTALGKGTHLLRIPALTVAPATHRTQMLTVGCVTAMVYSPPTNDLKGPMAKKRGAHTSPAPPRAQPKIPSATSSRNHNTVA